MKLLMQKNTIPFGRSCNFCIFIKKDYFAYCALYLEALETSAWGSYIKASKCREKVKIDIIHEEEGDIK